MKTNINTIKTISKPIPIPPKLLQNQYQYHQNYFKTNINTTKIFQSQYHKTKNFGFGACLISDQIFTDVRGKNDVVVNDARLRRSLFLTLFESTRAFIGSQQQGGEREKERKSEIKSRRTQRIEG